MPTHLEDEEALVAQAQMGDQGAFTTLYNQYSRKVYRFALRLTGDHQEAEEVLQDAFLKAFKHLGEFRNESRFSTWLISIAGNEALGRVRRRPAVRKEISLDAGIDFDGERLAPREIQDCRDDAEQAYRRLSHRRFCQR